ncbi:uncharacterized protein LOC142177637 isoform X2 [Nicotiana tabacum]|uniref:Uncharacterized protein LOC142177637 isoform X2 n=1 Tax=Nicotiana tabacum TaxID=4097 RepID=A0AC58U0L4_TOBAC
MLKAPSSFITTFKLIYDVHKYCKYNQINVRNNISMTTSKRVAERKVAKFEKIITKRGILHLDRDKKGGLEPIHVFLVLFAVLFLGSCCENGT